MILSIFLNSSYVNCFGGVSSIPINVPGELNVGCVSFGKGLVNSVRDDGSFVLLFQRRVFAEDVLQILKGDVIRWSEYVRNVPCLEEKEYKGPERCLRDEKGVGKNLLISILFVIRLMVEDVGNRGKVLTIVCCSRSSASVDQRNGVIRTEA